MAGFKELVLLSVAKHLTVFLQKCVSWITLHRNSTKKKKKNLYSKAVKAKITWTVIILETKWPSTFVYPSLYCFVLVLYTGIIYSFSSIKRLYELLIFSHLLSGEAREHYNIIRPHHISKDTLLLQKRAPDARQITLLSYYSTHIC